MNINQLNTLQNKLPTVVSALFIMILNALGTLAFSQQNEIASADTISHVQIIAKKEVNTDSLLQFAKTYLGTPYRLSGKTSKGFDCSGFVHHVYKKFDVKVPYSCPAISSVCPVKVKKTEVQKGDLLFFKGSNIKSKAIGHIAIVYAVQDGKIQMIHSCRRGVILETLNESKYYQARYLFAKRILE